MLAAGWFGGRALRRILEAHRAQVADTVERILAASPTPAPFRHRPAAPPDPPPRPPVSLDVRDRLRHAAHVEMRTLGLDPENMDHRIEFAERSRRS